MLLSRSLSIVVVVTTVLGACDADLEMLDNDEATADDYLRRFEMADFERPEVGRLSIRRENGSAGCTATLIGPRTVLSASHCFEFRSAVSNEPIATFLVQPTARDSVFAYPIHRVAVLGSKAQVGADIAVAQLEVAVPLEIAGPAAVAEQWPDGDEDMTVFGYGRFGQDCDSGSDGHKRKWTTSVGGILSALTCPGDSGGPFFHDRTGSIIAVVKGDFFGVEWVWSAVRHRDWIIDRLDASERGELGEDTPQVR